MSSKERAVCVCVCMSIHIRAFMALRCENYGTQQYEEGKGEDEDRPAVEESN